MLFVGVGEGEKFERKLSCDENSACPAGVARASRESNGIIGGRGKLSPLMIHSNF